MSFEAVQWAFTVPIKGTQKTLLITLAHHANKNGECWPSTKRLAFMSGCSRASICRHLKTLETMGLITCKACYDIDGGQKPNLYCLQMDSLVDETLEKNKIEEGVQLLQGDGDLIEGEVETGQRFSQVEAHPVSEHDEKGDCVRQGGVSGLGTNKDQLQLSRKCKYERSMNITNVVLGEERNDSLSLRESKTSSFYSAKDVLDIFEHWKETMNHPGAMLDDKRKQLIKKALKVGYTLEQLRSAITGCSYTPHNIGQNEQGQRYDGLHVVFRDAEHIERFMDNHEKPPKPLNKTEQLAQDNKRVCGEWAAKKMAESEGVF